MQFSGLLLFVALIPAAFAQEDKPDKWAIRRKFYPDLVQVFDLAETAPAPLRAMALQRIASVPKLKDKEWKRELLEESFDAAAVSPQPWPVDYVAIANANELRAKRVRQSLLSYQGLDRLTLQTNAILAMLALDQHEARQLWSRIAPLELHPLGCENGLIPAVEAYYQTASQMAKAGFSDAEKRKREDVEFLRMILAAVSSPVELGPVAKMFQDQPLSSAERSEFLATYAFHLNGMVHDDRSFSNSLDSVGTQIQALVNSSSKADELVVLKAWRNYLTRNLSGIRCAESVSPQTVYTSWQAAAILRFNEIAATESSLIAIDPTTLQPEKIDSGLPPENTSESPQQKDFRERWFNLTFGDQRNSLSDRQKNSVEWKTKFQDFLNDIENLSPSFEESAAEMTWRKCQLMGEAAIIAPEGPERERALDRYFSFLKVMNVQIDNLAEWYQEMQAHLTVAKMVNQGKERLLNTFENSGYPLLVLIAKLEKLDSAK